MAEDLSFLVMIDGEIEFGELLERLRLGVSGAKPWKHRSLKSRDYWLELRQNDDFDPDALDDPIDGFLYFRYRLEATPLSETVTQQARNQLTSEISNCLEKAELKAEICSQVEDE